MSFSIKKYLGAFLYDVPRYYFHLAMTSYTGGNNWILLRNRQEKLQLSDNQHGVKCLWNWTSELYLPKLFPNIGSRLLKQALKKNPITLSTKSPEAVNDPNVTFIIGHRGLERAPLLIKTLESIAGQKNCQIECIVVEQDYKPLLKDKLPSWVRYIYTPTDSLNTPYSRSKTFNDGALNAKADCLIFHDNDMLIPENYAEHIYQHINSGFDFINLKRFIFYLSEAATKEFIVGATNLANIRIESIVQNLEGGGSFGSSKTAYFEIGGLDERFIGWGGEDNEFWERAQTRRCWEFANLPIVHLWHSPQVEKAFKEDSAAKKLYWELQEYTPIQRISYLRKTRDFGHV